MKVLLLSEKRSKQKINHKANSIPFNKNKENIPFYYLNYITKSLKTEMVLTKDVKTVVVTYQLKFLMYGLIWWWYPYLIWYAFNYAYVSYC